MILSPEAMKDALTLATLSGTTPEAIVEKILRDAIAAHSPQPESVTP